MLFHNEIVPKLRTTSVSLKFEIIGQYSDPEKSYESLLIHQKTGFGTSNSYYKTACYGALSFLKKEGKLLMSVESIEAADTFIE